MDTKIKLDKSHISIVVCCTGCPWWYGFALDVVEAWQVGARHQTNTHPGNFQAAKNLHIAKKKLAEGLKNEVTPEN